MKYLIGAVFGIMAYHYYPSEVRSFAEKAGEVVHQGAIKAVEITTPVISKD